MLVDSSFDRAGELDASPTRSRPRTSAGRPASTRSGIRCMEPAAMRALRARHGRDRHSQDPPARARRCGPTAGRSAARLRDAGRQSAVRFDEEARTIAPVAWRVARSRRRGYAPRATARAGVTTAAPDGAPSRGADVSRRILHLDMDAFFAAVELLRRPDLKGKPVVIGGRGDPSRRGVVSTATYEARTFGIRSGMPLRTALKLCPAAVFLPVDFAEYRPLLGGVQGGDERAVSPLMEDRGIDEAYLDITEIDRPSDGHRGRDQARASTARPGSRARSASRRTSCSPRWPPNCRSRTA